MGGRVRGLAVVVVVLAVGAFAGSALGQWWSAPLPGERAPSTVRPIFGGGDGGGERIRVEVLNGGGRTGMARAATGDLRDVGFDVVYFGNGEPRDSSVVLARTDQVEWARRVADALGIRTVVAEPDSNLYLDVTVVLGEEWEPRPSVEEAPDTVPGWWDIRRFFRERPGSPPRPEQRLADPPAESGR